ncbi:porin [Niveispirillum fermenti]|uniref:porin n=1 Tax=Niveispirillum fermenti TaxID=1233113 RepID=UPI003A87DAE8
MMGRKFARRPAWPRAAVSGLALLAAGLTASPAMAGFTQTFGDGQSISIGLGMRGSYTSAEDAAPSGTDRSNDFNLDSVRLFVSGSLTDTIKATFNTERDGDGNLKLLDGYARFEFSDTFNIWVGRMLPPSDRSNLDGPYFINAWSYPGVVSQYPAKFAGRDDGATVWGKLADKRLTYAVGAFKGHNRIAGASNEGDKLLYTGRLAYNFLDVEDNPAYYTSSTYYGAADVLTLAIAGAYQADGVGTAANPGDYSVVSIDALFEKNLGTAGTVTLEGAWYSYDTDGVADVAPGFGGASGTDNVGGIVGGEAWLIGAAYLLPGKVGIGQFQPFARYQTFDPDGVPFDIEQYDVGVHYVIKGHAARISAEYSTIDAGPGPKLDRFTLGLQLQF